MNGVLGIHHVTAIAADAQRTLDFYAGVLGLRFVKRTVNFDDPGTYHFYFGDTVGSPGSLLTFFPWPGARRGRQGPGQVAVTSLAVAPGAIGFWIERLLRYGIAHEGPTTRGPPRADAERVLAIKDRDGLLLEIVGHARAEGRPAWAGARGIPPEHAIHGLHAVTVWVADGEATERVLVESMGFRPVREDGAMRRFAVGDGGAGTLVDVRSTGGFPPAVERAGTVHHVAWAVADGAAQLAMRERVLRADLDPTPLIDRRYFHSVYFREPGGVLFELATNGPGFAVDEPVERLGERLMLPPSLEAHRAAIEAALPPIRWPADRETVTAGGVLPGG